MGFFDVKRSEDFQAGSSVYLLYDDQRDSFGGGGEGGFQQNIVTIQVGNYAKPWLVGKSWSDCESSIELRITPEIDPVEHV